MPSDATPRRPSQTKIVATVGPACETTGQLADLIRAGVDVFRLNMAHGGPEQQLPRVERIREASRATGQVVAILADLAGPKMRLGELPGGEMECLPDAELVFVRGEGTGKPGELTTTYEPLLDELQPGDRVMLADGTVALRVERVEKNRAACRVVQAGLLRSRQGVNLPGVKLSVPTLGPKDRENAVWAARTGIDFVSLSFVRSADELRQLRCLVEGEGSEAHIVAKIEKPEAVDDLEAIVEATDVVMVARGDLGVEIDIATVPVVQKRIIACCTRHCKPVIVATQMLDSMQHSRLPTRAEATDVANAILDGADACMLSGETAIGRYPRESVEMMHRIALATEPVGKARAAEAMPDTASRQIDPITEATTFAAGQIAERLGAKMLVVASASGRTARSVSKNRHFVPTVGVSDSQSTLRRMCIYWGVIPLAGAPVESNAELLEFVIARAKEGGHLSPGDRVVLVAGTGVGSSQHNLVVVHEVEGGV